MRSGTIAWLCGSIWVLLKSQLPLTWSGPLMVAALIGLAFPRPCRLLACFVCGACWTGWHAVEWDDARAWIEAFPPQIEAVGTIQGVPRRNGDGWRFLFTPQALKAERRIGPTRSALWQIDWHEAASAPGPGETWRLTLRFRSLGVAAYPGAYDPVQSMLRRGVSAMATVVPDTPAQRLASPDWGGLGALRGYYATVMANVPSIPGTEGVLRALAVGDRSAIPAPVWARFRDTGTAHLLAISGLHITLAASLGVLFGVLLWRLWIRFPGTPPRRDTVLPLAAMAAAAYAALAAFSLPTTRALIMLLVPLVAIATRRRVSSSHGLALACLGVLIIDPFAPLDAGFWLSFGAVGLILAGLARRPMDTTALGDWLRIQVLLCVGLLPITLATFGQVPLASLPANLISIPWVTLTVVPLTLFGVLLHPWAPAVANAAWSVAGTCLSALNVYLEWLVSHLPPAALDIPGLASISAAVIGVALLAAPSGTPGRWVGALLLGAILLPGASPDEDETGLSVLASPRGLIAVATQGSRTLVYGSGGHGRFGMDEATRVILPYLAGRGRSLVDVLILGADSGGQRGGVRSLLGAGSVRKMLEPPGFPWPIPGARPCRSDSLSEYDRIRMVQTRGGGKPGCAMVFQGLDSVLVVAATGLGQLMDVAATEGSWLVTTGRALEALARPAEPAATALAGNPDQGVIGQWVNGRWCLWRIQDTGSVAFELDARGHLTLTTRKASQRWRGRRTDGAPVSAPDGNPVSCRLT